MTTVRMGSAMTEDAPIDPAAEANLKFLRRLITVLTATMIAGVLVLIALFVIRFPAQNAGGTDLTLPETLVLPDGTVPEAFTQTRTHWLVVTGDTVLSYDRNTGELIGLFDLTKTSN